MSAKTFLSALEALLSNGHQQTFMYDFLINSAVESGTWYLPGNMHYFSQTVFLEQIKELSENMK